MAGERGAPSKNALLVAILRLALGSGATVAAALQPQFAAAANDAAQGAQVFRNCLACHSIEPGQNMTGPSLAAIWGRKAATLETFHRYSDALKRSGVVWNEQTLDAWLRNPAALVPGNEMRFPGIPDANARSNLIAFLKAESEGNGRSVASRAGVSMDNGLPDLKDAKPDAQVNAIRYCDDTYTVSTASGKTLKFWEFNLRFKTDSSARGPRKGAPVLVGQGMQGDRAQVVFANPADIASVVKSECPP